MQVANLPESAMDQGSVLVVKGTHSKYNQKLSQKIRTQLIIGTNLIILSYIIPELKSSNK